MKIKKKLSNYNLIQVIWLISIGAMALVTYNVQLQYTNAYKGFLPIEMDSNYLFWSLFFLSLLGIAIPKNIEKPSDIFLLIYSLFVIISYILFYTSASKIHFFDFIFNLIILLIPFLIVLFLRSNKSKFEIKFNINPDFVLIVLVAASVFSVVLSWSLVGSSGGLNIDDTYVRRLNGREIFQAGSFVAYLNMMTMNGITPFLAFVGGLLNRKIFAILALLFTVSFFYTIGAKAPFALAVLAYVMGLAVRYKNLKLLLRSIFIIISMLFIAFIIEFYFNYRSEVVEYFFRRVLVVPGFDTQLYMNLIFEPGYSNWDPISGLKSDLDASYLVGLTFFNNIETNANTNAFIYALAANGYVGYIVIVLFVVGFFKALDALYEGSGNVGYFYIGFLYSFLLTEQAATTAFVSSGVGILFLLVISSGRGWHLHRTELPSQRSSYSTISA